MLSDFGPLEQGTIDQLSGSDHSMKGARATSRRSESVTYANSCRPVCCSREARVSLLSELK